MQALENERVQQKVADFEARRGPLEGLKQIADDPAYLAEWQERSEAKPETPTGAWPTMTPDRGNGRVERAAHDRRRLSRERGASIWIPKRSTRSSIGDAETVWIRSRRRLMIEPAASLIPIVTLKPTVLTDERPQTRSMSSRGTSETSDDDWAFLPCLRRGEPVPAGKGLPSLTRALNQLEEELRSSRRARPPRCPCACTGWRSSRRSC